MYPSGSLSGIILFTTGPNHTPVALTLDNSQNIYVVSYNSIYRFSRGSTSAKSIILVSSSSQKIQLDTAGNIYIYNGWYAASGLNRYRLVSSGC